jgi:hypothetical protein
MEKNMNNRIRQVFAKPLSLLSRGLLWALLYPALWGMSACDGNDKVERTPAEQLSGVWRIVTATANGLPLPYNTENFRLTFQQQGGAPSTFTIEPGSIPRGSLPTYNNLTNTGNWEIIPAGRTIRFLTNSNTDVSQVNYLEINPNRLTISWTVPESIDKTIPNYEFVLVR